MPPRRGATIPAATDTATSSGVRAPRPSPTGNAAGRFARGETGLDQSLRAAGSRVRLRNRLGSGRTRDVMAFRVARATADHSTIPEALRDDLPTWRRSQAAAVRRFTFRAGHTRQGRGWFVNGKPFDPSRTDVRTRLGAVEVWRFTADVHHPAHLHRTGFRVLSRDGRAPLPHDAGLKDTVPLRPGETAEVITRFDGHRGRCLLHRHNAEHEDMGMMADLEIVRHPGTPSYRP